MADLRDNTSAFGAPLLIGALVFGVVAAALGWVYLKSEKSALLAQFAGLGGEQVTLVVAAQDLQRGTVLRRELLSQRNIPSGFAPTDAIPIGDFERYLGRILEVEVGAGKPLAKSYVDTGFPTDFSDTVAVGRRAMTVQVDDINSIAGFLRPGNRIDLFVSIPTNLSGFSAGFITADLIDSIPANLRAAIPSELLAVARGATTADGAIEQLVSEALPKDVIMPVLQGARVLATGRDPYLEQLDALNYPQPRSESSFSTVTLDVSSHEAALLSTAQDKGSLLAILRNREDDGLSDFTTVSTQDLFSNAFKMRAAEAERRTRVAAAAGVDDQGNLVDADGNAVMNREQLAAAGLTVNANGELVDKDGNVVDPANLVVTADGRVLDKKKLAAAGMSVNASGQIIDKNGNVISTDDLIVGTDGKVLNKRELAAAGFAVNEAGEVVDASGRVVDPADLVTTSDGRILSKTQLAEAGLSVNEAGEIVDASGKVVDPNKLVVAPNGQVMTTEQLAEAGLSVNERGEIVDAQGNVVDPASIVIDDSGRIVAAATVRELYGPRSIDLIIGGSPTDGVTKTATLHPAE